VTPGEGVFEMREKGTSEMTRVIETSREEERR